MPHCALWQAIRTNKVITFRAKARAKLADLCAIMPQDDLLGSWVRDLTDEQCYKIWLAHGLDRSPNPVICRMTRAEAISFIRIMLGPPFPLDKLEELEHELTLAGEHELTDWMCRLRLSLQARN